MSKYTTEVRYICENAAGYDESKGYADVDDIIADSIDSVFSFAFPIFDSSYRDVLCTKILRHYYTREIGFETVGLWKLKMQTKLNEIMPYYNQLYNSELIKFNPLYDVDLHTTHVGDKTGETSKEANKTGVSIGENQRTESGTSNLNSNNIQGENRTGTARSDGTSTSASNEKDSKETEYSELGNDSRNAVKSNNYAETEGNTHYDLYSDTPQGALDGVEDEEYLTNARKITDSRTKNGKNDDTGIEENKYEKGGSTDESNSKESNSISNDNVRNNYDENTEKTSIGNESRTSDTSITDTNSRNDIENTNAKDKFNSTESYLLHVVGKQAGISYSKLLKEFRETFLNIDMEIINDLSDLFINLW